MAKINSTIVQIDWPTLPDVNMPPTEARKAAWDKWYFDLQTCVLRGMEELALKIDENKAGS